MWFSVSKFIVSLNDRDLYVERNTVTFKAELMEWLATAVSIRTLIDDESSLTTFFFTER